MMRIGLFSDSHGDTRAIDELLEKMGYIDAACFMGDIARDAYHLEQRLEAMPNKPELFAVKGNNDFSCMLPLDRLIELSGVRIYMTHGHMVVSPLSLAYRAAEKGARIALFGHTHVPFCEEAQGVLLINPGSAGNYCRGGRARASVLEIDRGRFRVLEIMI